MNHEYTSMDRIFAKYNRDIGGNFSETDLIEWTGEALEGIGTPALYDNYVAFVEVKDFQAPVPRFCHGINQIVRDNRWSGRKTSMFCPKKVVEAVTTDDSPAIPVALDCKGMPLHDYDLAYYRPFLDVKCPPNFIFGESGLCRAHYTPVRLHENTFFGSSVGQNSNWSGRDEYKIIQKTVLRFNFRSGFVAISYSKQALDPITGYPMIPDSYSHTTAIVKYVNMMTTQKEFYAGRQGAQGRFEKAEADWQWYCGQASNNDKMPYGIDEYQNFLDQRLQLVPKNNRYYGFFGNLALPQDAWWGGGRSGDEMDDCVTECETEEASACDTNCAVPSSKVINVTNITNIGGSGGGGSVSTNWLIGIAGHGGADDPIVGANYFENTKLIGLNPEMKIYVDDQRLSSYGINKSFNYFPLTGRIEFLTGYQWVAESTIEVDLNQLP